MLVGFAGAGVGGAQEASTATGSNTITVNARLVVLDVAVFDRYGQFVPHLDQSQFTIVEDKVPQKIRSFEGPKDHTMPIASVGRLMVRSSADLGKIGSAPVNVLVIDELNTPIMQITHAQQSMKHFLEQQPEVLPTPTLFLAAGASRIAVLHDFTQSRADLIESVGKHVTDADFSSFITGLNGGTVGADDGFSMTLGALSQIASSLRGKPGRKNVIWVGSGYATALDLNTMKDVDRKKTLAAIRTVTNRMLESRMTLYTVDPAGAMAPPVEDQEQELEFLNGGERVEDGDSPTLLAFNQFAKATGGAVIAGRNNLDKIVGMLSTEGDQYYTLSYSPSGSSVDDQSYKSVHVELKNPGLRAVTRKGYYAGADPVAAVASNTEKKQPQEIRFDLLSAARTTLVYGGLHVDAVRNGTGFTLMVRAKDLQFAQSADGSRLANVAVLAVAFDAKDKELGQKAAQLGNMLGAGDQIVEGSRVGFAFPFALPARTARVRFVVRDAAPGNLGSANLTP
jgi:VWFA-related protein